LKYLTYMRKTEAGTSNPDGETDQEKDERRKNMQARVNEDKTEASTYKKPFIVIKHVDYVDVVSKVNEKYRTFSDEELAYPELVNNYKIDPKIKFKHMIVVVQKSLRLYVMTDSTGHITTITRSLKLG